MSYKNYNVYNKLKGLRLVGLYYHRALNCIALISEYA